MAAAKATGDRASRGLEEMYLDWKGSCLPYNVKHGKKKKEYFGGRTRRGNEITSKNKNKNKNKKQGCKHLKHARTFLLSVIYPQDGDRASRGLEEMYLDWKGSCLPYKIKSKDVNT
jgi:hypothetical protein